MNPKQKLVLVLIVVLILLMLVFPPFELVLTNVTLNLGYGFLFSPPRAQGVSGNVNIGLLFMQFIVIVIAGIVGWFLFKNSA